uniref:TIR domain-containing protein n=1 Tax=Anopheles melas TaxID=34690 RepID=A0A182U4L9_9DIPT
MILVWMYCLSLMIVPAAHHLTVSNIFEISNFEYPGTKVIVWYNKQLLQLKLTCFEKPNFEMFRHNPKQRNYTFNKLTYQYCPLPIGNQSLVELLSVFLNRTQLSSIEWLSFVDNAKHSGKVTLDPLLFSGLNKLRALEINNLATISFDNPQLFKHLPHLKELKFFGRNRISGKLLHLLKQLDKLSIKDSEINIQPIELVSNLTNLQNLNFRNNSHKQIEQFAVLSSQVNLNIGYNKLVSLPEDKKERTRLTTNLLGINKNLIDFLANNQECSGIVLEDKLLAGLMMLQKVSASNCRITALPEKLFAGATEINIIDLSNNKLRSLSENLFRNLSNLVELYLQNNELNTMLPDTLLADTAKLHTLNLGHNKITTVNKHLLKSLGNLSTLQLGYNLLYLIDVDAFKSQSKSLTSLNLDHNRLTLYEESNDTILSNTEINSSSWVLFSTLNKVHHLDLSYNAIDHIFVPFQNFMESLETLKLSHNLITHIGYAELSFLYNINWVYLDSNKIAHLDFDVTFISSHHRLKNSIRLDDNPFHCDCLSYPLVTYIKAESNDSKSVLLEGLQCDQPLKLLGLQLQEVQLEDLICAIDASSAFCPTECKCYKRAVDQCAIVNCTAVNLTRVPVIHSPSIIECNFIELHLAQNNIRYLSNEGEGWNSVRWLNVSNNSLIALSAESLPKNLKLLDVSGNQLTEIDAVFIQKLNQSTLLNITLSSNPWKCDCANPLLTFAVDNAARITDYLVLQCTDGQSINSATLKELCAWLTLFRLYIVSAAVAVAFVGCILTIWLYVKYNLEIKVWLFKHNLLQWFATEEQIDMNKRYDAFISYSHKDEEFVTKELLPKLESEELNFKICWHVRDFMPGEMIANEITKAVEESRRTIIILSLNYLESVWGQIEFSTAYLQSLADKCNRVIPIIYQDIGDIEQLDPQLQAYLKTNTYVRWDDPWFWEKLHYAMPHKRRLKGVHGTDNMCMESVDKRNPLKTPTTTTVPINVVEKDDANGVGTGISDLSSERERTEPFITVLS